jgi:glycosyltransferase involved in cell wall biosynthesis
VNDERRLRVALGPLDPAGVGHALAQGLRARGHRAEVVRWRPDPYGYPADAYLADRRARVAFARSAPRRFDVLHGLGGRSWLSYADLAFARSLGVTCVIQYNGSDVRTSVQARRLHPRRAPVVDPALDRNVRRHRRLGAAVAHAAVVQDLELASYLVGIYRSIYVAPIAFDLAEVERARAAAESARREGEPLEVVHAGSNPRVKGTEAIRRAVREAAGEHPLSLTVVAGRPHREVLAALAGADLVVDQLNSETPGVVAIEAMAMAKPVLCEHAPEKLGSFARLSPLVAVSADTLAAELVRLARSPEIRSELGERGRRYALAVHAPKRAARAAELVYAHAGSGRRGVFEASPEGLSLVAGPPTPPGGAPSARPAPAGGGRRVAG